MNGDRRQRIEFACRSSVIAAVLVAAANLLILWERSSAARFRDTRVMRLFAARIFSV